MKYLRNSIIITLVVLVSKIQAQDTSTPSKLKDFKGIWQFVPHKGTEKEYRFKIFDLFNYSNRLTLFHNEDKSLLLIGPNIVGFLPVNKEIQRLSDLIHEGQRMFFFKPNPNAPNDSIKYFQQASPSCFASFNGLGTDWMEAPAKGEPNFFIFNFNGRDNELHVQIDHLPNYVLTALVNNEDELEKVELFLNKKYGRVKNSKTKIFSTHNQPTNMFLIKGDPVELLTQKGNLTKIRYYPEKNGVWTGKTIEGWIKQGDLE
jgi:hypothetical protein